jgi:hypothetical protein
MQHTLKQQLRKVYALRRQALAQQTDSDVLRGMEKQLQAVVAEI